MLPLHHRPLKADDPHRTGNLRAGDPALYRLSYIREIRPAGVEPAAPAVAERRSSPLSYGRLCRS
jgi:hypothetical protein